VLSNTLLGREEADENGRPITPANGGGLIVPNSVRVVSGDTVPNDIRVSGAGVSPRAHGLHEPSSTTPPSPSCARSASATDVPRAWTNQLRVSRMSVALIGRNLMLWSDVPHIDPETAFNPGNAQGFEYSQPPSARSIGFSGHDHAMTTRNSDMTMKPIE
jgi:hypothetical protein